MREERDIVEGVAEPGEIQVPHKCGYRTGREGVPCLPPPPEAASAIAHGGSRPNRRQFRLPRGWPAAAYRGSMLVASQKAEVEQQHSPPCTSSLPSTIRWTYSLSSDGQLRYVGP